MKRLLILILALTALTFNAEAKKKVYNYHSPKYWGNIELLGGTVFSGSSNIGISTVHGYCLGHGVSMGLGLGVYLDINEMYYLYSVPMFLETKYSPLKKGASPFVSLRTGFNITDGLGTGFHLSPALGIDIKRFSLFVRYGLNLFPVSVDIDFPDENIDVTTTANLKVHSLSIGFAVNF